jgi:hypothetical protein
MPVITATPESLPSRRLGSNGGFHNSAVRLVERHNDGKGRVFAFPLRSPKQQALR